MKTSVSGESGFLDLRGSTCDWPGVLAELETLRGGSARVVVVAVNTSTVVEDAPGDSVEQLRRFELPLVASLEGEISEGAALFALGCDVRVGGPDLRFRGQGEAAPIDAQAALEAGLISRVAADGGVLELARQLAATIASRGPIATRLAKEAIWRGLDMRFEQALRFETDLTLLLQTTKDRAEGVAAFLEKRTPTFKGE